MRVLGLATYPVEAAATRFRMVQFIEPLAKQGIELSVYPFIDSRLHGSLYRRSQWPRTALGLTVASVRRVRELWRARKADLLFVQREAMMFGPPVVEWLTINLHNCPMVLDLDDATYVSYKSPTYGRFGSMLKWFGKTNDLIRWSRLVTCGNREIAAYVSSKGRPAVVIPTVVEVARFRPLVERAVNDVPLVGWIGTHSTFRCLSVLRARNGFVCVSSEPARITLRFRAWRSRICRGSSRERSRTFSRWISESIRSLKTTGQWASRVSRRFNTWRWEFLLWLVRSVFARR